MVILTYTYDYLILLVGVTMKPKILNVIYEVLYGLPSLPGQVNSSLSQDISYITPGASQCLQLT